VTLTSQSGDGKLQKDEFFVGVEQFRNRLEYLVQEERRKAQTKSKIAAKEAEVSQLIESQLEINHQRQAPYSDRQDCFGLAGSVSTNGWMASCLDNSCCRVPTIRPSRLSRCCSLLDLPHHSTQWLFGLVCVEY
jgi:hypothetical protein